MTPNDPRDKKFREEAARLVIHERFRQDNKWGIQRHSYPLYRIILGEELGEADQSFLQTHFGGEHGGFDKLVNELVQVAAVAMAMVETALECDVSFIGEGNENEAGKIASVLGVVKT